MLSQQLLLQLLHHLAGKANSISTIFSLDIYKKFFHKNASEKQLVRTGRLTVVVAMLIATLVAPASRSLDQAYQFIQEYVGFISPGVLAIFLLDFCWKRTTSAAALTAALLTIPLSTVLKFLPSWTGRAFPDFPCLDRMSIVFGVLLLLMVVISVVAPPEDAGDKHKIEIDVAMFKCSSGFIIGSVIILGILTALYTVFW